MFPAPRVRLCVGEVVPMPTIPLCVWDEGVTRITSSRLWGDPLVLVFIIRGVLFLVPKKLFVLMPPLPLSSQGMTCSLPSRRIAPGRPVSFMTSQPDRLDRPPVTLGRPPSARLLPYRIGQ